MVSRDGVAETTENPDSWFFSEECVATEFVDLILDYLKTHNQLIKFEKKNDNNPNFIQEIKEDLINHKILNNG